MFGENVGVAEISRKSPRCSTATGGLRMVRPRGSAARPQGAHPRRSPFTLPACLRLADSAPPGAAGVYAAEPLPLGLALGPYEGLPVVTNAPTGAGGYSWRVRHGRLVDVVDETHSNWMRFVKCTKHTSHRNLVGFQHHGALYFRTVVPVAVGDELLVYYGDDYMHKVGIDGCYDYCPPKEELQPELALTSDRDADGSAKDDNASIIEVNDYCDSPQPSNTDADDSYGSPKEDPESKIIGVYNHPFKEEPEPELTATDGVSGDGGDDYACNVGIDVFDPFKEKREPGFGSDKDAVVVYDYSLPKEDPELKIIDVYDHPLKEEPEPELTATDSVSGDGGDDCARNICIDVDDCNQEEPELELGGGKDAVVVYEYCDYDLPEPKFVDVYSHPLKEEPEMEFCDADGDAVDNDSYYKRDSPKEEPEGDLTTTSDEIDAGGCRNIGYDCSHCGISLSTGEFKVEHELRCKAQMQRKELESPVTEVYYCGYCRCSFQNKEYKEQHQQKYCWKRPVVASRSYNGPRFGCDKCEFVTKWKNSLEKHLLMHEKNNAEWFTCTQCSYKTVHKSTMTRHMKMHTNSFSCCCSICGKSFRTKLDLDDHLVKWHFNESDKVSKLITSKIYMCDICNKYRTALKADLNKHVTITHLSGVECQKYRCLHCPYSTFHKENVKRHSKTHLEQKNYRCTVCKKQFTRKRDLDSHVLHNHADDVDLAKTITSKIHRCESCSYKTVILTDLKRHVQSKTHLIC